MHVYEWEDSFIWNDNMCISGDEAWFIGGIVNALFKLDLRTGEYKFMTDFPDSPIYAFRKYKVGIQCGKYILCFPDKGSSIWLFDTLNNDLKKIDLGLPDNARPGVTCAFHINGKIYAVASELRQIIELDISDTNSVVYYPVFETCGQGYLGHESISVNQYIYCINNAVNMICEFDTNTKEIKYYSVPNSESGFTAIGYGDGCFWLSGYTRELHVWDKKNNLFRIIEDLPADLGVYELDSEGQLTVNYEKKVFKTELFFKCINLKSVICFIPYQSNHIVYVDKSNYGLNIFELPDEAEDTNSWNRGMQHKYLVECVMPEENIILLYSIKNKAAIELNMENKEYKYKYYYLKEEDKQRIWELFHKNDKLIIENRDDDLYYFKKAAKRQGLKEVLAADAIGGKIHRFITK